MAKLTAAFVGRVLAGTVPPGRHRDGGGLLLNVRAPGKASWVMRYTLHGKQHDLGLGALDVIGLSEARKLVAQRKLALKANKLDPLAQRAQERAEAAKSVTFDQAAERYITEREGGWRNPKHRQQWRNTLKAYASPKIGHLPVREIDTAAVLSVLRPIWAQKPETASRLRGRVERILSACKVQGLRDGENPAVWRGQLAEVLTAKGKLPNGKVRHHPAVVVDDAPTLFARLGRPARLGDGKAPGNAAMAVQFCLLTASRPSEVTRATWNEIDRKAKVWTVGATRTKGGKSHRVPLSREALAILDAMDKRRDPASDFVFPGAKVGKPGTALSLASLQKALRVAMGKDLRTDCGEPATTHGSARSTFDDWSHEKTSHPSKLVDRALAHGPKDVTIAAYRRSELLEGRRALMADWGRFLNGATCR